MTRSFRHAASLFALLLLLLGRPPSAAIAQPDPSRPDSIAGSPSLKSPLVARGLSVGATAVPVGVGISSLTNRHWRRGALVTGGGLLLGPAVGILYAEAPGRALRGIGWRVGIGAGSAALTVGAASVVASSEGSFAGLAALGAGIVGGTCFVLAHSLYDILATTAQTVDAHNATVRENARRREHAAVSVEPWASPHTGTPGLQVRVSF